MSKKGLGRGLEALISNSINEDNVVRELPLNQIVPNPAQPRKEFSSESLQELTDSLKVHGLLQPIIVRPVGEQYHIIAGERRFRAAQLAGFNTITCIVQACSEQESAERAIVENIQRSNLSPLEEGFAYASLIKEYGLTQEEVAKRVGKGRPTIANLLRVIQLPEPVLQLLSEERISLGHAKLLLGLVDTSLQVLVARKAAKEGLSVRDTESLIQKLAGENNQVKKQQPIQTGMFGIEDKLRNRFQTKVSVKGDSKKGRIEIAYFSEDELNRLLDLWNVIIE